MLAKLLVARTPVKRTYETLGIAPETYYHKLELLYLKCLQFLDKHETTPLMNMDFQEVRLVGSVFQMLIQLMMIYEFTKIAVTKIEIRQVRRYLLVPSILVLIQGGIATSFAAKQCLEGRSIWAIDYYIHVNAGIVEYALMVFTLISFIMFLIGFIRLYIHK